jgi:hypothetical protein
MKRQSLPGSKDWIDELEFPGKHNQEDADLSIIRSVYSLIKWVLKDAGLLPTGEFLPDPDYPRRKTVTAWYQESGFSLTDQYVLDTAQEFIALPFAVS